MERLAAVFAKKEPVLNIYFTAGFPRLNDTATIIEALEASGADIVEIGMPYSDPIADGPTIQESNMQALQNGMTIPVLFEQIRHIRQKVRIPIILMGYINPVIQYGMERFLQQCQAIGVDATILPDMPLPEFLNEYQALYEKYGLTNIFLVTPQTSEARIRDIDAISRGFIYMVSSNSITGGKGEVAASQIAYFQRLQNMSLRNPRLIGFGISDHAAFMQASKYAEGAIIGSAFIRLLAQSKDLPTDIYRFVKSIKQGGA